MANFVNSSAMNLPIPVVGLAPGPDYATYINNCLSILDQHTHSAGSGNQITPDGINISGVLAFNGNDASLLRSIRYTPQASVLTGATDVGCTYVSGADLYYRDTVGNNVRITQSGGVSGSPGSIANLTSPASATYVGGSQTFVWQSGANLPANLDAGSIIVRNLSVNSNGITLSAPNALGSNYVLTLPSSPAASTKIVTMDSAGNLSPNYDVDQTTLTIASNNLQVKAGGIGTSQIAAGGVQTANIAALNVTTATIAANAVTLQKLAGVVNQPSGFSGTINTGYQTFATMSLSNASAGRLLVVSVTSGNLTSAIGQPGQTFTIRARTSYANQTVSGQIPGYIDTAAGNTVAYAVPVNWTFFFVANGSASYTETVYLDAVINFGTASFSGVVASYIV